MFIRPIQSIALLSFKLVFKFILPKLTLISYSKVFSALFSSTTALIGTVGIIPTFRVLYSVRNIVSGIANNRLIGINRYPDLLNLLRNNPSLHSFPVTIIANILQPFWTDLIKYPKIFNRFYNTFLFLNVLGLSRYLLRFTLYLSKFFLVGI